MAATETGAPAWRWRATPVAIAAVIKARLPMLPKTPRLRMRMLSAKSGADLPRSVCGESVHLVDENADADPLQRLPGAVEDDEGHERDPANLGSGAFDAAQQQIEHGGEQGG